MASRRLDVEDILEAVLDSDFGLSDDGDSEEEDGEDIYAYRGNSVLDRAWLSSETRRLTSDTMNNDASDDYGDYTAEEADPSYAASSEQEPEVSPDSPAMDTDESTALPEDLLSLSPSTQSSIDTSKCK